MCAPNSIGRCKRRCRKRVVDDQPRAALAGDLRDRRDIDDVERRVGRRFQEQHLRRRASSPRATGRDRRHRPAYVSRRSAAGCPRSPCGTNRTSPSRQRCDRRRSDPESNAALTAAMPLAVARATGAPSSAAMRSSNIATVGLEKRLYWIAVILAGEAALPPASPTHRRSPRSETAPPPFPGTACASARRERPASARAICRAFCSSPWAFV